MNYEKQESIKGKWVSGKDVKSGSKAKLVAETKPIPSQFKNKDGSIKNQDVSKIQFEGSSESLNININRPSINALVDAFGKDSIKWQGKELTVETIRTSVGGKIVYPLYLIPQGYEIKEDSGGFIFIGKSGEPEELPSINVDDNLDDAIKSDDLPF